MDLDLSSPQLRLVNRELSWLDFNERVLTLASDPDTPLLERAKFLAIFASNLDEFYMVRVAGLKRQVAAGVGIRSADGMTAAQQLAEISAKVSPLLQRHAGLFADEIAPALAKEGVEIVRWKDLEEEHRASLRGLFDEQVFPVLTPLAVDPAHPFPYISNLSLNLAVEVRDPSDATRHFARVKVPPLLPRFARPSSEEGIFVPMEDIIEAHLDRLFRGMEVVEHHAFRVTRNADLEVDDDDAEDLLEALEEELRKRRFRPAVRLEVEEGVPPNIIELLKREIQIDDEDLHTVRGPLDLSRLWELHALDRPDLKDDPFTPATHPMLIAGDDVLPDVFAVLRTRDILIHHPYDSFRTSVQRFIEQAAADPHVLAIKQTLYRTSGESPIVDALVDAAESGKQVVVTVEIQARFDERANIDFARRLERAGCHVSFGLVGLKTHCKLALVVRQEGDRIRRYVHVGTGNYNPTTARVYEDVGLLTADPRVGLDVAELFNYLTGYAREGRFKSLTVAPHGMRERVVAAIQREVEHVRNGRKGRVIFKLNALVDETIITALYDASTAGVEIALIIRGICALRPGVEGLSETIHVRSIVGRFLEHSRIMYFENGGSPEVLIGSADMMHRNLDRRVEVLLSVGSEDIRAELSSLLELAIADKRSAWVLDSSGSWNPPAAQDEGEMVDLQKELMERSRRDA